MNDPAFDPFLYRWRFNMETGSIPRIFLVLRINFLGPTQTGRVTEGPVSTFKCEFPRINESLNGYQNRFAYVVRFRDQAIPSADAVVMLSLPLPTTPYNNLTLSHHLCKTKIGKMRFWRWT